MELSHYLPSASGAEGIVVYDALEQIQDGFIYLDSRWHIVYANRIAAQLLGEKPENLVGKEILTNTRMKAFPNFRSTCQEVCETQTLLTFEEFNPLKLCWYEYRLHPIKDGLFIVIQDITNRKESENSLLENLQQYHNIINTSIEGIWILDDRFVTKFVNQKLAEMFGYQPQEMIGHRVEDFLFEEDWKDHKKRMKNRRKGISEHYERRFRRQDGSELWVIISATPMLDENGVFQGAFAMFSDITDRKLAEQALEKQQQLFNAMSQIAKIGAWEIDTDTLKATWTEETARIHDLNPEDETNIESELNFFAGDSRNIFSEALKEALDHGIPYDIELKLKTAKGNHKWVRTVGKPLKQNGRVAKVQGIFQDITERKKFEEVIQQSNLFLNSIIDQSPIAMWISDSKGTLIRVNPALCKLLNITPEEVIGKYNIFEDNIIIEQNLISLVKQVYKEGKTVRFALRYDSSQLKSIPIEKFAFVILDVTIFPIKDINGGITNAVIQLNNITERKIAEDALRQSEFKFRKFVEEASVGIILIDEKGQIIEWNRAMVELTGYPRSQILYTPCWDLHWHLIPEEQRKEVTIPAIKSQILEALRAGEAPFLNQPIEMAIKNANGEIRYLLQSVFPIKFEHGFWLGIITRDVTVRKMAEEKLRQSEDKFSKAFQASPNLLVITHLSDGKIIEVNNVFINRLGYSREEVIGHTSSELNLWADRVQLREYLNTLKTQAHVREMEVRFVDKSGNILDCLLSGDIILLDNEPCIISTILDITERKQQEMQIERQLQRLAALRSIDTAITSSFDLRVTLRILLDQVTTQLNIDAALVLTYDPNLNILECVAQRGFHNNSILRQQFQLNEDLASQVVLERRLICIPDLLQEEHPFAFVKFVNNEDFSAYFAAPLVVKGLVKGVLEVFHRTPLHPDPEWLDFFETIAGQTAIAIDNAELFQGLQRSNAELILAYNETLEGWSTALDLRDRETEGHSQRVVELTIQLAKAMGVKESELVHIRRGALLHDIGKMGVPDSILLKPGTLTEEEWRIKLKHPEYAYQMLSPIAYLRQALDIPYCHHEKWDGTGYPRGLKEEQIPLAARIFALVDVWDALRSHRPYRPAWSDDEALNYIREQSGLHFDPAVVDAFFDLLPSIMEIEARISS
ncbi:MAG: PAS domain S-box protein [Chloroflexi bacterium]|nr:PAS domain S-box protein [Chloroflexota bacterium]